jgi:alkylhydroperoxidase/carboxymuconolactone decarboxylase family protein YurZ
MAQKRKTVAKTSAKKQASTTAAEKKKYFKDVLKIRGFRFGLHQIHAEADWEFIKKFEEWVKFIYLSDRHLDRRVKELVITGILCALRSPPPHIKTHMNKAVEAGATKEEIIVVAELAGHWGGTVAQANALEAWRLQFAPKLPGIFEPVGRQ